MLLPASAIEWQPALAARQPWRAWTAAWVHYSSAHLALNMAGAVLVAMLGAFARVPARAAAAWALAWPLTHAALLLRPGLAHYGGLSGVLHAGVAVVAVALLGAGARRVGGALLLGLLAKVASEAPWAAALPYSDALGIRVVPFSHAAGLVAGVLCALLLAAWRQPGTDFRETRSR